MCLRGRQSTCSEQRVDYLGNVWQQDVNELVHQERGTYGMHNY